MKWINIDKSLPQDDEEVLLWDGNTNLIHVGFYMGKGRVLKEGFYRIGNEGRSEKLEHITHYMEMPGAPP